MPIGYVPRKDKFDAAAMAFASALLCGVRAKDHAPDARCRQALNSAARNGR
ncbi:MAG: hypothetical protein U1F98_17215 [Verrucomicrobiota bacterium]